MTNFCTLYADVPIVTFAKRTLRRRFLKQFERATAETDKCNARAGIWDLRLLGVLKHSEIAMVLEYAVSKAVDTIIGIAADDGQIKQLTDAGVVGVLPCAADPTQLMQNRQIRRHALARTTVFVYASARSDGLLPLLGNRALCFADFAGITPLERQAMDIAALGPKSMVVHVAQDAPEICRHLRQKIGHRAHLEFVVDDAQRPQADHKRLIPSLRASYNRGFGWSGDVLGVDVCANIQGDLIDFVAQHKAHRADITLAAGHDRPGLFALSEAAFPFIAQHDSRISLSQLAKRLGTCDAGIVCQTRDGISQSDITTPNGYFDMWSGLFSKGQRLAKGYRRRSATVIAHETAVMDAPLTTDAQVVLGPDAHVQSGAKLSGVVVVGRNSRIERDAFATNSIIAPDTRLQSGAWLDHVIAGPTWCFAWNVVQSDGPALLSAEYVCTNLQHSVAKDDATNTIIFAKSA